MAAKSLTAKSQAELAVTLNVAPKTIESWRAAGMPGERGRYIVADVIRWRRVRDEARRKRPAELEEIENRHAEVKLQRDELKLEREEVALIERGVVESDFEARVEELTHNLTGLCEAIAPQLAPAMDPRDVEAILDDAVYSFLDAYSQPLPEEDEPEEEGEA